MKTNRLLITLVLFGSLLLSACDTSAKVGALQTESQSVALGDVESVHVEVDFGAGDLLVSGGAEDLLEADFTYNVARLKPEVAYRNGTLVVRQPDTRGWPDLRSVTDFRNEWDLFLYDQVPMDLIVNVGGGTGNLNLAGLSLTDLDVSLGAGNYTVDLSGDWVRDLDVSIDAGAAALTVRLPKDVGVRVEVASGPHTVDAAGLVKNGDAYTNAAYGISDVALRVNLEAGIGFITLEVESDAAAAPGDSAAEG